MNIHTRPYKNDPTRWYVDVKLMHPTTHTEIRKRLVAPAVLTAAGKVDPRPRSARFAKP
jgi:hypothetical protein